MKWFLMTLLPIGLMMIATVTIVPFTHFTISYSADPVPSKSDVFFISNTRTCRHWDTDAQMPINPAWPMIADAESLYDQAMRLAMDASCGTNSMMAYDCLEKSARLGCGRAQFVLATLWDFDASAFRLGCVDPEVDPRLSQPRFESISFCSDHNGIHARDIKMVSRNRKIDSTLINGDAARMALYWYRAAVESGINAAMPPMLDLRRKLDQERDRYLGKMKADTAIYSACWLLNRDPLHKDCRCRCPTVRKWPKKLRAEIPCKCPRYNDASLAMEILNRAAKDGNGSARLALAVAEEILIDPLFSFRDAEFKDVVAKFYGDARTLYRFAYPNGSITNSQVVAYVTSLYRKAIEAGDVNAPEQLTRFRKRVAAALPKKKDQKRSSHDWTSSYKWRLDELRSLVDAFEHETSRLQHLETRNGRTSEVEELRKMVSILRKRCLGGMPQLRSAFVTEDTDRIFICQMPYPFRQEIVDRIERIAGCKWHEPKSRHWRRMGVHGFVTPKRIYNLMESDAESEEIFGQLGRVIDDLWASDMRIDPVSKCEMQNMILETIARNGTVFTDNTDALDLLATCSVLVESADFEVCTENPDALICFGRYLAKCSEATCDVGAKKNVATPVTLERHRKWLLNILVKPLSGFTRKNGKDETSRLLDKLEEVSDLSYEEIQSLKRGMRFGRIENFSIWLL